MSKRVYISGPMTGLPEFNVHAFHAAARRLRGLGFEVINPAEINADASKSWHDCMRGDIKALCDCDVIALLPGWEGSNGAHLELHIAHRIGLEISTMDQLLMSDELAQLRQRMEELDETLAALVNEPQPLGIDRPVYIKALGVVLANRKELAT